jgi:hypothetical protein
MCETVGESGFLYHIFRVNPNDARLDTSTPHRVDERNHSQICKYIRDDDDIFGYIVEFIRKIRNNAIPIDELNGPLWKK